MSDYEEICLVLTQYASSIDSRNWPLLSSCFTEHCLLDYNGYGKWNSAAAMTSFMMNAHSGPSLHRLTNFDVSTKGSQATARCYVDALVFGPASWIGINSTGFYDDVLVKTIEGWKIEKRTYTTIRIRFMGVFSFIPSKMVAWIAKLGAERVSR